MLHSNRMQMWDVQWCSRCKPKLTISYPKLGVQFSITDLQNLMVTQLLLVLVGGAAMPEPPCNLNGVLHAGHCVCDAAWSGHSCEILAVLPVPRDAGYRQPHTSSWGGNAVYNNTTGLYHGFFSELVNHCGMATWETNSRIVHMGGCENPSPWYNEDGSAIRACEHYQPGVDVATAHDGYLGPYSTPRYNVTCLELNITSPSPTGFHSEDPVVWRNTRGEDI
jgi:hypothetical protein